MDDLLSESVDSADRKKQQLNKSVINCNELCENLLFISVRK